MPTRKNHTSKKSNTKFRKTRAKRQIRKSKNKPRSKRQRGGVSRKGGSNPADDDYGDLFTNSGFAEIVAAEKAAKTAAENGSRGGGDKQTINKGRKCRTYRQYAEKSK